MSSGLSALVLGAAWFPDISGAAVAAAIKPALKLAPDGFPFGHHSPEGAACDVVRALIRRDEKLFLATCVRLYVRGSGPEAYAKFLRETLRGMRQESARSEPSPRGPKIIAEVFAARDLTRSGPASYGYAAFGFQGVAFVDVIVGLQDGDRSLMRTLVIKDTDAKWYVHPVPEVSPLLCEGLDDEPPSTLKLADVYELKPQ